MTHIDSWYDPFGNTGMGVEAFFVSNLISLLESASNNGVSVLMIVCVCVVLCV